MAAELDIGPLTWVKGEIDQALERARENLAGFAGNTADLSPLRFCQTHLHQVTGAIQMVGLEGAARVSDEIEALVMALEKQEVEPSGANIHALTQAIAALAKYLTELLDGEADVPLKLYPAYKNLREARGTKDFSESDLFFPDLSARAPKDPAAKPVSESQLPALAKNERARFQWGLLKFLRDPSDRQGLEAMREALLAVERAQALPAQRTFWWSAGALIEGLLNQGLSADAEGKRLLGKIDQQIRKLAEASPKVAERLMREVLYRVACSKPVSERIKLVKKVFDLDACIPQATATGAAADAARLQPLLRELRELLAPVKDSWLKFTAGHKDSLKNLQEPLNKLVEKSRALDVRPMLELLQQTQAVIAAQTDQGAGEVVAMEVATALLLAENVLENFSQFGEQLAKQLEIQTRRMAAVLSGQLEEIAAAEIPYLGDISRKAQEKLLLAQVAQEILANLRRTEEVLDAFFRDNAKREELPSLDPILKQVSGALKILELDKADRLLALCHASIRNFANPDYPLTPQEQEGVAEGLSGLGFFIDEIQHSRPDAEKTLGRILAHLTGEPEAGVAAAEEEPAEEPAEETIEAGLPAQKQLAQDSLQEWQAHPEDQEARAKLEKTLAGLAQDADLVADAALKEQTAAARRLLEEAPQAPAAELAGAVAALSEAKAPHVVPSKEAERLIEASEEAIDAELLETYLEEAAEVLATVSENLQICHGQPHDKEALTTIRRGFHTLKGSGRMVGLTDLGEVAWAVEQVMNKWLQEEKAATPELLDFVQQARDSFEQWVGRLSEEGTVTVEADDLVAQAEQLKSGEPEQAAAPPVLAEEDAEQALVAGLDLEGAAEVEAAPAAEVMEELSLPVLEEVPATTELVTPQIEESWSFELPVEEAAVPAEPAEELVLPAYEPLEVAEPASVEAEWAAEPEAVAEMPEPVPEMAAIEEIALPAFEVAEEAAAVPAEAPAEFEELAVEGGIAEPEAQAETETEVVIGDTVVPSALLEIFMAEARQKLEVLQQELAWTGEQPEEGVRHDFMRAAHTLCGISRTVGFPAPAELSFALEELLIEFREHPQPVSGKQFKIMDDATVALGKMVEAVEQRKPPKPAKQVIRSLQALVKKARAESEKAAAALAAAVPAAEPEVLVQVEPKVEPEAAVSGEPSAIREVAMPTSTDDIDPDILPLFLEEAQDLYPLTGNQVREWRERPADEQAPQNLQRTLHTFKGSARMAGALRLGDLVHNMETRVIESLEGAIPTAEFFEELFAYFDRIGDLMDALQGKPAAAPVAEEQALTPVQQALQPLTPAAVAAKPGVQQLRVRADILDRLVNEAGEISIARSRVEGEMQGFKQSLLELTENVIRLRNQLREIEIQAESRMQSQTSQGGVADAFDPLEFDRFTRFQELTRFLAESVNDVATVQQNLLKSLGEADAALVQQARLNRELQQELMHIRMVPLSSIDDRLYRIVRQTARELDKKAGLEIRGGEVELDRSMLEKMTAPFEHLLRNSLAHGVEKPADRVRAGKAEVGLISVEARQEGNEIVLSVSDDGAGFNLERIRARAVKLGMLAADAAPAPARLIDMIFEPGFSTAEEVTQVAGRGVGMDVVRSEIASLGGRIEATTGANGGASFVIYLPLTLAVAQAVLVRAGEKIYALPSTMVEQVKEFKAADLEEVHRKGEIVWLNNHYPLYYLPRLLGDMEHLPEAHRYTMTLLLRSGTQRAAVQVDEILGNQEVVVKNIGPQLARVPGIAGATVLGNGRVALIINPVPLVQRLAQQEPVAVAEKPKEVVAPEVTVPTIMVVDDSLTVRKITTRLLAKEGYQVVTAKDGVDALQQLQEIMPDVMLVDIEMPRMDGFELTKNVRGDAHTAHIPIIMITSRTADKHRNYAKELGVNAYLGKPFQEDELLGHIAGFIKKQSS